MVALTHAQPRLVCFAPTLILTCVKCARLVIYFQKTIALQTKTACLLQQELVLNFPAPKLSITRPTLALAPSQFASKMELVKFATQMEESPAR
jgi:hypothetical protein